MRNSIMRNSFNMLYKLSHKIEQYALLLKKAIYDDSFSIVRLATTVKFFHPIENSPVLTWDPLREQ